MTAITNKLMKTILYYNSISILLNSNLYNRLLVIKLKNREFNITEIESNKIYDGCHIRFATSKFYFEELIVDSSTSCICTVAEI